jgi:hypothetical protein
MFVSVRDVPSSSGLKESSVRYVGIVKISSIEAN